MGGASIIRSGWWVALAAAVLTLVAAAFLLVPLFDRTSWPARAEDFDLTSATVPEELVVRAMNRDGVMVLNQPEMMTAAEVDRLNGEERGKMLVPDDRVIGVEIAGDARAYPIRLMRWHEVVNDVVGGLPVAVTYSPLCDSVVVFDRTTGEREIDVGVSGLLYNSNTLLYDRGSGPAATPLWVQLTGVPITDPGGEAPRLNPRMASLVTWSDWRKDHPATRVLAPVPAMKKPYARNPFNSYFGSDLLRFPVEPLPPAGPLELKDRVVIVTIDGVDSAVTMPDLAAAAGSTAGSLELTISGLPLRVRFDAVLGVAAVRADGQPNRLDAVRYAFWFASYSLEGTVPVIIRDAT